MELQNLMNRFKVDQTKTSQDTAPVQQAAISPPAPEEAAVASPKMITLDDEEFGKY